MGAHPAHADAARDSAEPWLTFPEAVTVCQRLAPAGHIKLRSLQLARARGDLQSIRKMGRVYTTESALREWIGTDDACHAHQKALASISVAAPAAPPSTSSETARTSMALASAQATAQKLRGRSKRILQPSTGRRRKRQTTSVLSSSPT